jgi:hypothetical protein
MPDSAPANQLAMLEALRAILDALQEQVRTDATLRTHLATLGHALLAIANEPDITAAAITPPVEAPAVEPSNATPAEPEASVHVEPLSIPTTPIETSSLPPASPPATQDDIKRWQRALQGHSDDEPDKQPARIASTFSEEPDEATFLNELSNCCAAKAERIQHALAQPGAARAPAAESCDYWMDPLLTTSTISSVQWEALAGAYEAIATIVETFAEVLTDPTLANYRKTGFDLTAEAQSALRAAVAQIRPLADPSQEALFQWLRRRAQNERVFIERYMRRDDVADPAHWPDRLERITAWCEAVEQVIYRRRHEQKLFGKLRYHAGRVEKGFAEDWPRVLQIIEALIDHGIPPSNRTLRTILDPHRATLAVAGTNSRIIARVVRELERTQSAPSNGQRSDLNAERDDPLISQVADLLRDTTVVLIGGDERPQVVQTIEEAFDLRELVWCDTRPHKSHLPLEAAIARAEVSVVLLAIRWASHGLSEVSTFCERYQKPFVRLPGGYNINQLAYQVLQQASERLKATRAEGK